MRFELLPTLRREYFGWRLRDQEPFVVIGSKTLILSSNRMGSGPEGGDQAAGMEFCQSELASHHICPKNPCGDHCLGGWNFARSRGLLHFAGLQNFIFPCTNELQESGFLQQLAAYCGAPVGAELVDCSRPLWDPLTHLRRLSKSDEAQNLVSPIS